MTTQLHVPPVAIKPRIQSLDVLKGFVMVVMALDHVRDYFHYDAFFFSPENVDLTNGAAFFTRWITHFCAPVFSFLAGTSAYLVGQIKSRMELSAFLVKRGIWLIFIQMTLVNFAWTFDIFFRYNELGVIWSLGVSMILLAALIHLPRSVILVISCIVIIAHNLLDQVTADTMLWSILHKDQLFVIPTDRLLFVVYPLIPWIGIMALGYWFGRYFERGSRASSRRQMLLTTGTLAVIAFVLLRATNLYGDPKPWMEYDLPMKSVISFFNVNKYPPSLLFVLMTLGPAMICLALIENTSNRVTEFFATFGRVPFFYYILHLYLIHLLASLAALLTAYGPHMFVLTDWVSVVDALDGYGFGLPAVYLVWIAVVIMLYPACVVFDRYKSTHKQFRWLSYL